MTKKMMIYILLVIILLAAFLGYSLLKVRLAPTVSVSGPDLNLSRDTVRQLYEHVKHLSVHIGSRSIHEYDKIEETKNYIVSCLEELGYAPILQDYKYEGKVYSNVIVSIKGEKHPGETIVFGAHYDTVYGTPGADDNASAVAVLLEICRALKDFSPGKTLKLIFFTLEEPPVFRSKSMGSYVYASEAKRKGEDIRAMVCLEMVGYYNDKKGGQAFPLPFMNLVYPSTPNFIAVVGNLKSKSLVKKVKDALSKGSDIPVETLSTVSLVPGIDFSDHRSFWKMGYPAVMVTDTAFYRNPNYHSPADTIDTLNFDKMSSLLTGLVQVAKDLTD
ncbi:MAG: M20/M25/M40 family metallo-hydrolase [Proteobacteria bacterium]|nr:M20/M25/M40 family metallo-hydrolase [Pseudomonadota bacterium]